MHSGVHSHKTFKGLIRRGWSHHYTCMFKVKGIVHMLSLNIDSIVLSMHTLNIRFILWMQAFSVVFQNAIDRAEASTDVKERVHNLIDSITYLVFMYTTRGLFEEDKLIFTSQVTFQVSILYSHSPLSGGDCIWLMYLSLSFVRVI